jgi:ABC-type polysaccharide/polyol phosphate transport system ATPase subunit
MSPAALTTPSPVSDLTTATNDFAVTAENVSVVYRSYIRRPTSLKETLIRFARRTREPTYSTFHALQGVSLQIPRGSVFALVGSNGCGKSTLLKVIAGVLKPTSGSVTLQGDVASLIELGAGFDPDLTAIENIYLNGSLHKKTRAEMNSRVEHILSFAELHEFAFTPIKYYSSGMYARLGFSVAVDVDPDILLVDEILGVGDERFQDKCAAVFDELIARGKTIILVTHNMKLVQEKAQGAALLQKGQLLYVGDPNEAVRIYREGTYQSALS